MENRLALFELGKSFEVTETISPALMKAFCELSGDDNPIHLDSAFAVVHGFRDRIAYGNLLGAMLSRLVGTALPCREVLIVKQSLEFRQPAYVGDEIRLIAEVAAIHEAVSSVNLKLQFHSKDSDRLLCSGQCLVKIL